MKNITFLYAILCLIIFHQVSSEGLGYYFIGTSRGVVTIVQTAPNAWKLKEMPFTYNYSSQLFVHVDPFIRCNMNYNLVWNLQGGKFTSGTPIQLLQTTTQTNSNNWLITPGYSKIVLNYAQNMVANVTETGDLVLATATSVPALSAYQRMYPLDMESFLTVVIDNQSNGTIHISTTAQTGPWSATVAKGKQVSTTFYPGTVITILDSNGNAIAPSAFTITAGVGSSYIRVPPPAPFIGITHYWTGYYMANSTHNVTVSLNLTFDDLGNLVGNGTDSVFGTLEISGSYTVGGKFSMYIGYAPFDFGDFEGYLDVTSTKMTGNYTYQKFTNVFITLSETS